MAGLLTARFLIACAAIGIWQLLIVAHVANKAILPGPDPTFRYPWFDIIRSGTMWTQIVSTLEAIGISFVIGNPLGIVVGFLLVSFPSAERVMDFYLTLFNSFPRVALAPSFIALFGLGQTAKIITTITVIIFIVINGR